MRALTTSLLCALALAACESKGSPANPANGSNPSTTGNEPAPGTGSGNGSNPELGDGGSQSPGVTGDLLRSTQPGLQWKRYAAFENDLAAALALPKDAICKELGGVNCIRGVHLSPLGGHDPFKSGLLEPSGEPLATTPTVVERIVLSACSARAELEGSGKEKAQVFTGIDLKGAAPAPTDASTLALVTNLYRRLLARDPDAEESQIVAGLALDAEGKPVPALSFVKSACFAIGTSSEFLFF